MSNAAQDPYTAKAGQDDVNVKQKVDELAQIVKQIKVTMLTTRDPGSDELHSRAMYPASTDSLQFTFFGNRESGKFEGIEKDHHVNLSYYDSGSSSWISVAGVANVSDDRAKIERLYTPQLKAWFGDLGDGEHDGGPHDPRVELIEVSPREIRYFLETKGTLAKAADVVASAITGNTATPGVLRTLKGHELETAKTIVGNTVKL